MNRTAASWTCPVGHAPPAPGSCRLCWLYEHDTRYRRHFDGAPAPGPARRGLPCVHLGALVEHGRCRCPRRDLRACDKGHGAVSQEQHCETCGDYEPDGDPDDPDQAGPSAVRHLLMHVYPLAEGGVWQWNLDQLAARWGRFNGRKVFAVVTGPGLDPPAAVADYLAGCDGWELFEVPNQPGLREVATFEQLLERVETDDPREALFYCHTKGATHAHRPGDTGGDWMRIMYAACLDDWDSVRDALTKCPVVGCFRRAGPFFQGTRSRWHYSGSFLWARSRDVFARRWRHIDRVWWGVEAWSGLHFTLEESACLVGADCGTLYQAHEMARQREAWRRRA